ncbi:MAG: uracil-DNA glycosylase [Armatimonadota bacterium]
MAARGLQELAEQIRVCPLCRLSTTRTNAVPGEGAATARIMFIGEGPGEQEDRSGRPFVGAAGQLLDRLMLQAGLHRSEVFITNIVKCRPPGNRAPLPDEVLACRPYLDAQMALLNARLIGLLGRFATHSLLSPKLLMSQAHGIPHEHDGMVLVPLYHPAAALRRPSLQPLLVEDLRQLTVLLAEQQGENSSKIRE